MFWKCCFWLAETSFAATGRSEVGMYMRISRCEWTFLLPAHAQMLIRLVVDQRTEVEIVTTGAYLLFDTYRYVYKLLITNYYLAPIGGEGEGNSEGIPPLFPPPSPPIFLCYYLDVTCITQHEGFDAVCLNKYVLWAALVSLHDRECAWLPPEDNIPNR